MSVNKYNPHILVLPEDDANRQLATGFLLEVDEKRRRQMQVLKPARGWRQVLDLLSSVHFAEMRSNAKRSMILLIDFDNDLNRLTEDPARIPEDLVDRVFFLGVLSTPEQLKSAGLGSYEAIGSGLATDCRNNSDGIWGHDLLKHNAGEVARLRQHIRPILFDTPV